MLLRVLILHHLFGCALLFDLVTLFNEHLELVKMNERKSKLAYDIKCKVKCKTRSLASFQKEGIVVNASRHGYEYDKTCQFPFKWMNQTFHGCVWSDSHDSVGPWCYTETEGALMPVTNENGTQHYPIGHQGKPKKWGICSDECPIEDCVPCESSIDGNIHNDDCNRKNWPDNISEFHFGAALWCFTDKDRKQWKFCSKKCKNHPKKINSICKDTFISASSEEFHITTRATCWKKEANHNYTSCPIVTNEGKNPIMWAICTDDCPSVVIRKDANYFLSIFLPIIGVLLLIFGIFIYWGKRKVIHTGRFTPKNKLHLNDINTSENQSKAHEKIDRKYRMKLEMENEEGLVYEHALLNQNFTSSLEGDLTKINPTKSLNEQVHIIPYNSRYEIDFSCFTTHKIIGSGNFGTVYEGEANIPLLSSGKTKVAIKTVSQQSNQDQFSALISEIKILSNLNPHINLVNMLGCCTSKLATDGKVWLFIEYCNESDIKTYLIEHTKIFMTGNVSSSFRKFLDCKTQYSSFNLI